METSGTFSVFIEFYIPSVITEQEITDRIVVYFYALQRAKASYFKGPLVAVLPPPRPQLGRSFRETKRRYQNLARTFLAVGDAMGVPAIPLQCMAIYSPEKNAFLIHQDSKEVALYGPGGQPSAELYRRMAERFKNYL